MKKKVWAKHILWQDSVANLNTSKNKYFSLDTYINLWEIGITIKWMNLLISLFCFSKSSSISKADYVSNSQQQEYGDRQGNPNIEINHFSQPKPSARQTGVKGLRGVFAQKAFGKSQQSHLQGSRRFSLRRSSPSLWAKKALETHSDKSHVFWCF